MHFNLTSTFVFTSSAWDFICRDRLWKLQKILLACDPNQNPLPSFLEVDVLCLVVMGGKLFILKINRHYSFGLEGPSPGDVMNSLIYDYKTFPWKGLTGTHYYPPIIWPVLLSTMVALSSTDEHPVILSTPPLHTSWCHIRPDLPPTWEGTLFLPHSRPHD